MDERDPEQARREERGRRVRAALAWHYPKSVKNSVIQEDFALGKDHHNLDEWRRGEAHWHEKRDLLTSIAGVPEWFVEYGFDPPAHAVERDLRERIAALEDQMSKFRQGEGARYPPPPSASRTPPQVDEPKPESPEPPATDPDTDAEQGADG